jgi:glycosyltransferase involved in cell wall biosynthesis
MRKVYLSTLHRLHSLEDSILQYPPEGYEIVFKKKTQRVVFDHTKKLWPSAHSFAQRGLGKVVNVRLLKVFLDKFEKLPDDVDLIYSVGNLVLKHKPWVADTETVTEFINYKTRELPRYKRFLENTFASKWCKKIMPFTDSIAKSILMNLDCRNFEDKIETVHIAIPPKRFKKRHNKEKVRLLFVGTSNVGNISRGLYYNSFDLRGGRNALEAFSRLDKKYDNLELVIRCPVPEDVKRKNAGAKNIKIIDRILPWRTMENIFKSSDVLFFPVYEWFARGILDAMSYELPVVATDVGGNSEMVKDGKTGLLIKKSKYVPYYVRHFIPNNTFEYFKAIKETQQDVIDDLVEKTSILIENKNLRRKMGAAGRREIEEGEFSIKRRNEKLKRIFDEAIG